MDEVRGGGFVTDGALISVDGVPIAIVPTGHGLAPPIEPAAPPCPHCDAGRGERCWPTCPGKLEATS